MKMYSTHPKMMWVFVCFLFVCFLFSFVVFFFLQVFLLADVMYSFLVHQYDLYHGLPRVDDSGTPVKLKLS